MADVRRGAELLEKPDMAEPFAAGDRVYLAGTEEAIARALPLFGASALAVGGNQAAH